jgi:hypothetical protein
MANKEEVTFTPRAQTVSTVQFSQPTFVFTESTASMNVMVTRTGDASSFATVSYTTSDTASSNCTAVSGQASSHCDYLLTLGTLVFASGETSKTILIPIVDDAIHEGAENFSIALSNPVGVTLGGQTTATLTINDNDSSTGANPIDNSSFFVRQHYVDFLNREPDAPGLAFWVDGIETCTPKPSCTEVRRIDASAAFFLSIEFQETGYLVYRMHKASFGNLNGGTAPVPVRLAPFLHDTQEIGQGVIVGVGNWQAQLEANKQAFALEFVQRPEFLTAFPNTKTAAEFVDQMNTNAGNVLSPSERTTLINILVPDPTDVSRRAQVLRLVAEDQTLHDAELNKAFVLMQYFGYLRRNPDDVGFDGNPDPIFLGFNFWLG